MVASIMLHLKKQNDEMQLHQGETACTVAVGNSVDTLAD